MDKKVKEVKAAVSLIYEENAVLIKKLIKNFTKKTSKDSFLNNKRERGSQ